MFLIYFHVILHKFVSALLRTPCVFPMIFDGNPTRYISVIFEKSKFVNLSYV